MINIKKNITKLILIISLCVLSPKANAFFYPVGPVFDPLNIAGEAITTVSTVANKVMSIKSTINEQINNIKKALADTIGNVLGGKREPGKVPGAKKIEGSNYVDYSDETAVKEAIYTLFWTYPEDASDLEAQGYRTKSTEFYQDNVLEVWAAVRGLEAELENIKKDTQTLTEEIRDDTSGGQNLGLNELWEKAYEAYKTYDMLYALIEEMTAMKAQVIMSKAIKYDVKPKYNETISSSMLKHTFVIANAQEATCGEDQMFCDGSASSGSVPFAHSKKDVEELKKFDPVRTLLLEAIEYHNTMQSLVAYQEIFKSLENTKELHSKSIQMLTKSDNCVTSFLGRYYEDPNQLWFGSKDAPPSNEHEKRLGLSGWIYNGLYVAEKALETQTTQSEYTTRTEDPPQGEEISTDVAIQGAGGVKQPELSTGTTGADQEQPTLKTADKYEGYGDYAIKTGGKEEIEGEFVQSDPATENEVDLASQEKESENLGKTMEGDEDVGFESQEDLQKQTDDVRKLNQTYWNIGAMGLKDLTNNPSAWGAKVKNRYPVWYDQKLFYSDYVAQKYANIKEYLITLDISKLLEMITGELIKDRTQFASTKEIEYNTTSLALRTIATNVATAEVASANIDKGQEQTRIKYQRDNAIDSAAAILTDALSSYNIKNQDILSSFSNKTSKETQAQILAQDAQRILNSLTTEIKTVLALQHDQAVTDSVEIEPFSFVFKNVILEFNNPTQSLSTVVDPIEVLTAESSKRLSSSKDSVLDVIQSNVNQIKDDLTDISLGIQTIFTEDYQNATSGGNPYDVTSIKSKSSTLDEYKQEVSDFQDKLTTFNNQIESQLNKITDSAHSTANIEKYQEEIVEIKYSLGSQEGMIASIQETKDAIVSDAIDPLTQNLAIISEALVTIKDNDTLLGTTVDTASVTSMKSQLAQLQTQISNINASISVPEIEEGYSNAYLVSTINSVNDAINREVSEYNTNLSTIIADNQKAIATINDTLEVKYQTIEDGNTLAINNINSYTENRQDGTGEEIAAIPLHDIIGKVEEQINQSKNNVETIVDKYAALAADVQREDYRPENHNVFVNIHDKMFDEIMALKIDINTIATDSIILMSLNVFEYLLREYKLNAGDQDEYKVVDTLYFVGGNPQYRDLRIPRYPEKTEDFHPRELIYFDEVDWVNVGGRDKTITKEKFLRATNYLPQVWRNMLSQNSFVEKEFDLQKALSTVGGNTEQELIRGGLYPCKLASGELIDVIKYAEFVKTGKWYNKKLKLEWSYNYVYALPKPNTEYTTCVLELAKLDIPIKEDGLFGRINMEPHILTTSFGYVRFVERAAEDIKEAQDYSELGMFLASPTVFNQEANPIYAEIDAKRQDKAGESSDSVSTFDDYIVKHIPFKINQIGDFLRSADEEQELKKSVDELLAKLDIIKWGDDENDAKENHDTNGLFDKLQKAGYYPNETYTLTNQVLYDATHKKLKEEKESLVKSADNYLEIMIDISSTTDPKTGITQENEVALERKAMLKDIIRALNQDTEGYLTIGEAPLSEAQMTEDINAEKVNREANKKHKEESDNKMKEELDAFQEPYCAAY